MQSNNKILKTIRT